MKTKLTILFICCYLVQLSAQIKSSSNYDYAVNLFNTKQYELATRTFLDLKEVYTEQNDSLMLAKTYRYLGNIFLNNKDYKKARYYLFKAQKTTKNKAIRHNVLTNLASLNFNEEHLDSTIFYFKKILQDSAYRKDNSKMAFAHRNIVAVYIEKKNSLLAKKHADSSIYYSKTLNNTNNLIALYDYLGSLHYIQQKYHIANEHYSKGYELLNDSTSIYRRKTILTNLMRTNYIIGNTNFARKIDVLREDILDSINKLEFNEKVTKIEAQHNEEKARTDEAVKTEKQRQAKVRTQYALIGTGMFSAIIILLGTVMYRNSKLKAKSLAFNLVTQELNQQKALRLLEEQNQRKLLNATLDGRETERQSIAQTLHDSVSALLSSANMHIQVARKKSTTTLEELNKSQLIINEASEKVRDLSHKLISAVLLKFGLEHAVYDMCEKYSNTELQLELETNDKIPRFEQTYEIKIHNIIEECINNIIKHSKAKNATVFMQYNNAILEVIITDNGIGFDTSKINPSSGIGLSQIKARVENLEGTFTILSTINIGTEIKINIPLQTT